jgi:hypothetical protein
MRRVWKYRIAVVFLLLAMLIGGTGTISVSVMEITFALVLAFVVGIVIILLIMSWLKKKT